MPVRPPSIIHLFTFEETLTGFQQSSSKNKQSKYSAGVTRQPYQDLTLTAESRSQATEWTIDQTI